MKYVAILSALLVACLLAFPALAAHNGDAAQNRIATQNGNCGEDCGCTNCPNGDQDGLGNQYGNPENGNPDGDHDGDRARDRARDGSCQD